MPVLKPHILVDIGGTHIRLARLGHLGHDAFYDPVHWSCADFPSFEEALFSYDPDCVKAGHTVSVAWAAQHHGADIWRFTNHNNWVVDLPALRQKGVRIEAPVNDLVAMAYGCADPDLHLAYRVQEGEVDAGKPSLIVGIGTGCGLAWLIPLEEGGYHVQETYGGHMANPHEPEFSIFEDVLSGAGYRKYSFDYFASTLASALAAWVITGHGFGGVYLAGGVIGDVVKDELKRAQLKKALQAEFDQPYVKIVKDALQNLPVSIIEDPYLALRGLSYRVRKT